MKYLALSLLLVATAAVADIGSVTDVTGTAIVKRGNTSVTLVKGTAIEMNDRVAVSYTHLTLPTNREV